ncbi:MAG TPA: hypothetical protein VJ256_03675 [Dehalococcoidia bacterium]|nr:hypothetical protein [Dehalococcoidia bacterium]HLB29275.1 hypothetical protein [Dehalococcoidia bacterium]
MVLDIPAGQDPWETAQAIRAEPGLAALRIVALCDELPRLRRRRLLEDVVWLVKPFSLVAFLRAMRHLSVPSDARSDRG